MTRFINALNKKRAAFNSDKGFTLIELLVVVIIIGILAAIAIPIYIGVQNSAKDSSVQSDLTNAKTAVVASYTATNTMPTAVSGLSSYGFTGTTAIKLTGTDVNAFCLTAPSQTTTGSYFYVTANGGVSKTAVASASLPSGCTA